MFENYRFTASERFKRYVQVDTQSDPQSTTHPTTEKQKDLSRLLADDTSQVLRMSEYPYLKTQIGNDIITASGLTLLGADDKAGVAEIMDLANFFVNNKNLKHGEIRILFTPDEEVGKGTAKVDLHKLGADFGYTL